MFFQFSFTLWCIVLFFNLIKIIKALVHCCYGILEINNIAVMEFWWNLKSSAILEAWYKFFYKNCWILFDKYVNKYFFLKVMGTWTRQMGYPLVNVERSRNTLTITQQRFLVDRNASFNEDESIFRYKWDIHLTYVTSATGSKIHECWLYHDQPSGLKFYFLSL